MLHLLKLHSDWQALKEHTVLILTRKCLETPGSQNELNCPVFQSWAGSSRSIKLCSFLLEMLWRRSWRKDTLKMEDANLSDRLSTNCCWYFPSASSMASTVCHDLFKVVSCIDEIEGARMVGLEINTSVYPIDGRSCSYWCSEL